MADLQHPADEPVAVRCHGVVRPADSAARTAATDHGRSRWPMTIISEGLPR